MEVPVSTSVGAKLEKLSGLLETQDLSDWEHDFITSVYDQSQEAKRTSLLSEKQVGKIEQIYAKHFGG